jgi:hypothetical protein
MLVSHHYASIADLDFGVSDAAIRTVHSHSLRCAECRLVKLDRRRAISDDQIGL